jgi:hypothetical protein
MKMPVGGYTYTYQFFEFLQVPDRQTHEHTQIFKHTHTHRVISMKT